jgi:hypothetical protein
VKQQPTQDMTLTGQFLKELLFVQSVFERLPAIDENYRDLISELTFELIVGFHINLAPAESAAPLQLRKFLLYDLAKVASLAGVHDDFARS